MRQKQQKFGFQEVITPILGSEYLYQTSGHLDHYQDAMFPALSRNNETFCLRPMTCPHGEETHLLGDPLTIVLPDQDRTFSDVPR